MPDDPWLRLIVPTAALAEHLRHTFVRSATVVRPSRIVTLSQLVESWTRDLTEASTATLHLAVERAVTLRALPEFSRVAGMPGFHAALARTIDELASAGVTARDARLPDALRAVWAEVDADFERRGIALRAARLRKAASRIHAQGLGSIHSVRMEGFLRLAPPELELVEALRRHAAVVIAPPVAGPARAREEVFAAASPDREAVEIARRIAESRRPFRETGIVVHDPGLYVP
ncbi:MAG: hypothetical protein ACRD96_12735, partial [Bryobacteraceae bacterium]